MAQSAVATVAVGTTPIAVEANPVTHKVYVVNHGSNSVTIIDGATRATTTVAVEDRPEAVAINPKTNQGLHYQCRRRFGLGDRWWN